VLHLHRGMIRFALSGYSDREMVLKAAGLSHQFFSKPCDAARLRASIASAFHFRDLVQNPQIQAQVTTVECLPVNPRTLRELSALLAEPDAAPSAVADLVSQDLALSAKILHMAHWAFFMPQAQARTIERAVHYLGIEMLRDLVLRSGFIRTLDEDLMSRFPIEALYQHSRAVGAMAGRVARALSPDEHVADEAAVAGLLHDIGRMVLIASRSETYEAVLAEQRITGEPLHELETRVFGVHHGLIGGALMLLWGIPGRIADAIASHHEPGAADDAASPVVTAVHVADALVHEAGHGAPPSECLNTTYIEEQGLRSFIPEWRGLAEPAMAR
jgi:putative nucleotidyltransferase with HDIG domain